MEVYQDEAAEFLVEDVEGIVRQAIHTSLNEHSYNPKKVNEWTNLIVTNCLKDLQALNRPFKYIITSIIMQKNGAGLCTSATMLWDQTDGLCKGETNPFFIIRNVLYNIFLLQFLGKIPPCTA